MTPDLARRSRILAMQSLCELEVQGERALVDLPILLDSAGLPAESFQRARDLIRSFWEHRSLVDCRLAQVATDWSLERLSVVDRNILRVAATELLAGDVPPRVILNEAIEIGREYGGPDSPAFINGVLDGVWRSFEAEKEKA